MEGERRRWWAPSTGERGEGVVAVVARKRTRAWAEWAETGREKSRVVTAKMPIRQVNLVAGSTIIL
jgi:hypothetical protein